MRVNGKEIPLKKPQTLQEFLLEQGDLSADQLDTLLTCAQRLDHPRFTSRILAKTQPKASTRWADKSFDL